MRLGILGGSFDPIHHGHLILARAAREELGLDRILFLPANVSPHKTYRRPAPAADRLAMVTLAVKDEPGFEPCDLELRRPPPSFTVDTLRDLAALHPDAELVLLIGADNVAKFHTWREADAIPQLAKIAVLERDSGAPPHTWPVVRRLVDISSTEIRGRASRGLAIRYLTPDSVCGYIIANGLYRTSDS